MEIGSGCDVAVVAMCRLPVHIAFFATILHLSLWWVVDHVKYQSSTHHFVPAVVDVVVAAAAAVSVAENPTGWMTAAPK